MTTPKPMASRWPMRKLLMFTERPRWIEKRMIVLKQQYKYTIQILSKIKTE
jgi:hypothetical protein